MVTKSSRKNRIGLIAGLVAFVVGVAGTIVYVHFATSSQTQTVTVVKAKVDIPAATAITNDMLYTVSVPSTDQPAGSFADPSAIVGEYSQVPIPKDTTIISADFSGGAQQSPNAGGGGTTGPVSTGIGPAFALPDGYVAMAMPIDPEVSVGYYIQPHDRVDFIVNTPKGISYGFQDVEVLAVGGASAGSNSGGSVSAAPRQDNLMIVSLPRRQAEQLAAMLVTTPGSTTSTSPVGILRLVLRPKANYGKGPISSGADHPTQAPSDPPVTSQSLATLFG